MSRSYKKHDYCGNGGASSEKLAKSMANRILRHSSKQLLHINPEAEILPVLREISDVWSFPKDGKSYFGHMKNVKSHERRFPHSELSKDSYYEKLYRKLKRK